MNIQQLRQRRQSAPLLAELRPRPPAQTPHPRGLTVSRSASTLVAPLAAAPETHPLPAPCLAHCCSHARRTLQITRLIC